MSAQVQTEFSLEPTTARSWRVEAILETEGGDNARHTTPLLLAHEAAAEFHRLCGVGYRVRMVCQLPFGERSWSWRSTAWADEPAFTRK
jgi:hypothetical protein